MGGGPAERDDAFGFGWPTFAAALGLLGDVLASAGKFDALVELALLPVLLIGFGAAAVWVIMLSLGISRRHWKRAASMLAALPAAALAIPGLWSGLDLASEARLVAKHASYEGEVAGLPGPVGQRRARWDWGGNTTAVTGGDLNWLVYDETDTLPAALDAGKPWPNAERPWFDPDRFAPRAARLWGHFYRVGETVP